MIISVVIQSSGRPIVAFVNEPDAVDYAKGMLARGPQAEVVNVELHYGQISYPEGTAARKTVSLK